MLKETYTLRTLREDDESSTFVKPKRRLFGCLSSWLRSSINTDVLSPLRSVLVTANSRLDVGTFGVITSSKHFVSSRQFAKQQRRELLFKVYIYLKLTKHTNSPSKGDRWLKIQCGLEMLSIALHFGRTHQVRLINRCLLGDNVYNSPSNNFAKRLYNRQSLSAIILSLKCNLVTKPLTSLEYILDPVTRYTFLSLYKFT
ncbi:MAG: hypothetical protein ACTS6G_00355 [Candidatus Hodgkinia cicadicola]